MWQHQADGVFLIMLHRSSKCIIMVLLLFPRGHNAGEIKLSQSMEKCSSHVVFLCDFEAWLAVNKY